MLLAVALLLGLCLAASLVGLNSLRQQDHRRLQTVRTYAVLLELGQAGQAVRSEQVGTRGYMLNQDAGELARLAAGRKDLLNHLAELQKLLQDNPLQQSRLDRIQTLVARRAREVDSLLIEP
ncbi:MAG TPA: CHASE3 domain-containing protein, partial [Rhodanobacter sp.]|nr:CHASE3 domain-containing protein [Rhodanobacter sp.]